MKYYTLEELKPGMRVSIASLDKIVGTTIVLDKRTYTKDKNEIGFADILYVGNDAKEKTNFNVSDVFCIYNSYDMASEDISEE